MAASNKYQAYKNYMRVIAEHASLLPCFFCTAFMVAKTFQRHLLSDHPNEYSNRDSCPWCLGDYIYPRREKWRAVQHMNDCFSAFLERNQRAEPDHPASPINPPAQPSSQPEQQQPPPAAAEPAAAEPDQPPAAAAAAEQQPPPPPAEPNPRYSLNHLRKTCIEKNLHNRVLPDTIDQELLCDDTLFPLTPEMNWWHDLPNYPSYLEYWDANDDLGIQMVKQTHVIQNSMPRSTIRFFHLMVRASSFPSFVQQMRQYGPNAFLLPFSCLCDGGTTARNGTTSRNRENALKNVSREHLIHRHMILVARDGPHFLKHCWQEVGKVPKKSPVVRGRGRGSRGPRRGNRGRGKAGPSSNNNNNNNNNSNNNTRRTNERRVYTKKFVRILDWFHMKNAIVYVSNLRSTCNFHTVKNPRIRKFPYHEEESIEEEDDNNPNNTDRRGRNRMPNNFHFYIMRSITEFFEWMGAFSLPTGLFKELNQRFGQKKVETYMHHVSRVQTPSGRRRYGIQIKHLVPDTMMNMVLPVAKKFLPLQLCPSPITPYYLHLEGHLLLIFTKEEEWSRQVDDVQWYEHQAYRGLNKFLNIVDDVYWYPPRHQQRVLAAVFAMKAHCEEQRVAERQQHRELSRWLDRVIMERDRYLEDSIDSGILHREEIADIRSEHQEVINNMRREFVEEKTKILSEHQTLIETMKREFKEEIARKIEEQKETNRILANWLKFIIEERNRWVDRNREHQGQLQSKNEEITRISQQLEEQKVKTQEKNEEIIRLHQLLEKHSNANLERLQLQIRELKKENERLKEENQRLYDVLYR